MAVKEAEPWEKTGGSIKSVDGVVMKKNIKTGSSSDREYKSA